jgi:hypothetical protein
MQLRRAHVILVVFQIKLVEGVTAGTMTEWKVGQEEIEGGFGDFSYRGP